MLELQNQHKYSQLTYNLPAEILPKLFYLLITGGLTWAGILGFIEIAQGSAEFKIVHLALALFPMIFIKLLYAIIKGIKVKRRLHILAGEQQVRWLLYENKSIIEDVNIYRKNIKNINVYIRSSFGRHSFAIFTFSMKNGKQYELRDDASFSFGHKGSVDIKNFFAQVGFGQTSDL
jgi:hypothetical protein